MLARHIANCVILVRFKNFSLIFYVNESWIYILSYYFHLIWAGKCVLVRRLEMYFSCVCSSDQCKPARRICGRYSSTASLPSETCTMTFVVPRCTTVGAVEGDITHPSRRLASSGRRWMIIVGRKLGISKSLCWKSRAARITALTLSFTSADKLHLNYALMRFIKWAYLL